MKTTRITILFLLGITAPFIFYGCLEENFIPDPSDPRLPKYTESGNQVGGALINNLAWKTNFYIDYDGPGPNRSFYFTNYSTDDSVMLNLDGLYTEGPDKGVPITFEVVIKHMSLANLNDVKQKLDEEIFYLDGVNSYVTMSELCYGQCFQATGGTGVLQFKNVKNLVCTKPNANGDQYCQTIIAGVFNFNFPNEGIQVESGRFDFKISESYLDQK